MNHTNETASLQISGTELMTQAVAEGTLEVSAGGVAVVRTPLTAPGGDHS
ncbi:MAG TPA: Beta-galactosidase C-terminal domain [Microbacterium sp.]|nr:Beta-galactosidase C-terminal domain [Microbacterium sp.]